MNYWLQVFYQKRFVYSPEYPNTCLELHKGIQDQPKELGKCPELTILR